MFRHLFLALVLISGVVLFTGLGVQTPATAQPSVDSCPDRLSRDSDSLVCRCSAEQVASGGTIWGSDTYTDDSPICRAALHAGVIGSNGGVVEVRGAPGRSSYPQVTRNGITSGSWASYPRSITFTGGRRTGMQDCPSAMAEGVSSLTCSCTADAASGGSIWGSDVYTGDSRICRAALHAGVIGPDGGVVSVRSLPGRSSYPSVERNGVTSSSWASYPRSITFEGGGSSDGK